MAKITIVSSGPLTSLQTPSPRGTRYYGFPLGGPLDRTSASLANALVGNSLSAPTVEFHQIPAALYFDAPAVIALTGAQMHWNLDQQSLPLAQSIRVAKGSVLRGSPASAGFRGYLAVSGLTPTIVRSETTPSSDEPTQSSEPTRSLHSTRLLDHALSRGDQLVFVNERPRVAISVSGIGTTLGAATIRGLPGPEYAALADTSRHALVDSVFRVTPQSNRMGARLAGPPLAVTTGLIESCPVVPGMIQLTPSGQCIVVLQDGQTTGGYPRIAYLPSMQLDRFNQIPINQPFHLAIE